MTENCPTCGLPEELCRCQEIAREQQTVKITTDPRRYGKLMTIIQGVAPSEIDSITTELKTKCACGGTHKGGHIELQGDHVKKVRKFLEEKGFTVQS